MNDSTIRVAITSMPPGGFEQLVHDLVRAEAGPSASKVAPPDGGADTIVEGPDGRIVVQAKHFTTPLKSAHWRACKESLERALAVYQPIRVEFVFAHDLTARERAEFARRLEPIAGAVDLTWWGTSELVHRLDRYPAIRRRHLGLNADDHDALIAAARVGGTVRSFTDVVARSSDLSRLVDGLDPDFEYSTATTPAGRAQGAAFPGSPYLTVGLVDEVSEHVVAAWPRPGVEAPLPTIVFAGSDAGRAALAEARERLARGETARVPGHAVDVGFQRVPRVLRDTLAEFPPTRDAFFELRAGQPLEAVLAVGDGDEIESVDVRLYRVPPAGDQPGASAAFRGIAGAVICELLLIRDEDGVRGNVNVGARFGPCAADNLRAADLVARWAHGENLTVRCERLGEIGVAADAAPEPEPVETLVGWRELSRDLVRIEAALGTCFVVPEVISPDDALRARIAAVLLSGEPASLPLRPSISFSGLALPAPRQTRRIIRPSIDVLGVRVPLGELDATVREVAVSAQRRFGREWILALTPAVDGQTDAAA